MMPLEDDGAGMEGSSQWRDQDHINIQAPYLFPCLQRLLHSAFRYLHVHVLSIELGVQVDLTLEVVLPYLMLDHSLSSVVLRFSVTDEVNHQIYNTISEVRVNQAFKKDCFVEFFILYSYEFHNNSMNKQHKSQQQSKSQSRIQKEGCKLPYLNSNSQMPYPYQARTKKHASVHRNFDLNTNYASIPRYSALQDKNLAYFFDKVKNKKLLEDLKAQQSRKSKKSQTKTHRQAQYNRSRQVSQIDFLQYIQKMKKKVTEVPQNP